MTLHTRNTLALILFLLLAVHANANDKDKNIPHINQDSINMKIDLLNDETEDLMDDHPANDLYNSIWTSEKLNPYKICIDSLPDSVNICMADYCAPIPFQKITSDFGSRKYRYHYGTDLKLQIGDSVLSSFAGKVRIIDYERKGYGHYVVIRHENGLETVYAHLSKVLVNLDQTVSAGEVIALGGNTGRSTGPHLHYEIRFLGNAMNPAKIIDFDQGHPFQEDYLITRKETFYYQKEVQALAAIKYYRIRSGDNLSRIAARNGTSVKTLCRLNGISPKKILRIGQSIRVR